MQSPVSSQNSVKSIKRSSSSNWINSSFQSYDYAENDVFSECGKPVKKASSKALKHFTNSKSHKVAVGNEVPWAEKFVPTTKEDLAVHKKKVSEVEDWLKANLISLQKERTQRPGILLLTGPAGVGKTAVIKALANDLRFEIMEWLSSPCESIPYSRYNNDVFMHPRDMVNDVTYQSQTAIFKDFFLRANKYPSLFSTSVNRVILVEEFPNIFLRDAGVFHDLLRKFRKSAKCPAVFIVSDCTSGESLENHLFPKSLQTELKVTNICFNPIAPTMLIKALNRICCNVKELFNNNSVSKNGLENIAANSMGDVRSAVNALQFLSIQNSGKRGSSQSNMSSFPKRRKNEKTESSANCDNQRDSSLFLFHALGKILYCKRDPGKQSSCEKLPPHLAHFERIPLVANPEEVYEKTSISAENFALFLHENYSAFVDDINVAAESSSYLSQADVVSVEWTGRDVLNEYTASIASRGLMFSLKPNISSHRWRPLHKPQFFNRVKDSNSLRSCLKNMFKDTRLSLKELETEFIPYLPKIGLSFLSAEKSKLASEIGQIAVKKFHRLQGESLSEKDSIKDDASSQLMIPTLSNSKLASSSSNLVPNELEEEICIEEYDF